MRHFEREQIAAKRAVLSQDRDVQDMVVLGFMKGLWVGLTVSLFVGVGGFFFGLMAMRGN